MALAIPAACTEPGHIEEVKPAATETDGNVTGPAGSETGSGPHEFVGCLAFPKDNQFGWVHRCEGDLSIRFEADAGVEGQLSFDFDAYFGDPYVLDDPDDNFANPKVMACCSPLDPPLDPFDPDYNEDLALSDQYKFCFHDFIEQGCRSLKIRMQEVADGLGDVPKEQLTELANWIGANQQACRDTFWPQARDWQYSTQEEWLELTGSWELPDGTLLNGWSSLSDIVVSLHSSPANRIYSVSLPANPNDWTTCPSQYENNDNTFAVADDPIDDFVLSSGSVDLDGPPLVPEGERIAGSASLKSTGTNCDLCSTFSRIPDGDHRIIDYFLLDVEGTLVGTSTETLTLDRARILLYEPENARNTSFNRWTIAAGEAIFIVSAVADGEVGIVRASNSSAIDFQWNFWTGWSTLPFEIEYEDSNADTWTISIGTLTWEQ